MRKMVTSSLFALGALAIIYALLVDLHTHAFRPPDHFTIAGVLLVVLFGMIGFMWISGYGFSGNPKVSKYNH